MRFLRHKAWISLMVLLAVAAPVSVLAQDDAVRVDGSRIVADIVEPLAESLGQTIQLEISGTSSGIARLCSGEIDIANAARPITNDEIEACAANDVQWLEVPLGFDALAIVSNPAITGAQCMTLSQMSTLFGPSASETVTTLSQVNPAWGAGAMQTYAPQSSDTTFNLLDSLLPGDGLRTDFTTLETADALIAAVAENVEGIGFAPLSAALASDAAINILAVDGMTGAGCVAPDQASLEDGSYPAARGLYMYVNAAALEREPVQTLLAAAVGDAGQAVAADAGFVSLSSSLAQQAATNLTEGVTGRQFSQGEPLYTIPLDVAGTVTVQTAAAANHALETVTNAFTNAYGDVSVTTGGLGNAAAYRQLCSSEADLAAVTRAATAEEAALCEENGISLWQAELGQRALVMVVPEAADFAACLTADQTAQLWASEGGQTLTNWRELGEDFPDLPVTVFLPVNTTNQAGFLLSTVSDTLLAPRADALERRNDPLYRAAATANVEGAITYMTYAEYLTTDAAIMPVAVDAGEGCVVPSIETIRDGSYTIAEPVTLVVRTDALSRPEVQAAVWYAVQNGPSALENASVLPADAGAFATYQEEAAAAFETSGSAASADTESSD
ncbi:MAG: substrate-binding domain-containing protein [Anaerolineae bacterium]|nr:substrate-binding domain-containing protein [Anaerolineae bacterium]